MFHEPARGSWTVGAKSPYRAPVLYAPAPAPERPAPGSPEPTGSRNA
ncbi:hypothetical protein AB0L10_06360 [Streptomyces flaveolus]